MDVLPLALARGRIEEAIPLGGDRVIRKEYYRFCENVKD
jgi:hypothetical protein